LKWQGPGRRTFSRDWSILFADDYDLFRVNPIQYAGASGLSEAEGIELFVHAAKVGLFEMDWLLICAYCPQVAWQFSRTRSGSSTLSMRVLQRAQRCSARRLHPGRFHGLQQRPRHCFPPSRGAVRRGLLSALQLFQGFQAAAWNDARAAHCGALQGICRY